jgi:hypothetical protein
MVAKQEKLTAFFRESPLILQRRIIEVE